MSTVTTTPRNQPLATPTLGDAGSRAPPGQATLDGLPGCRGPGHWEFLSGLFGVQPKMPDLRRFWPTEKQARRRPGALRSSPAQETPPLEVLDGDALGRFNASPPSKDRL